jgi:aminoglycoside/choline kinase family phosphotransferase
MTSRSPELLSNPVVDLVATALDSPARSVQISRVTGDASTRSYFRARAGDRSLIVCRYAAPFDEAVRASDRLASSEATNPSARLTFANDPCAHIETTLLFGEAGLPVPKLIGSSGGAGVLLIEDVGDVRLQDWMTARPPAEIVTAYRRALRIIVKIQEATDLVCRNGSICSNLAFDESKLRWELGFFFANYFNKHLRLRLDPEAATAVQSEFRELCAELAARPRVLAHRDYHARNLMMHNDDIFMIDFQDARLGPASYDVASLLSDPYSPLDRPAAAQLAEEFAELKADSGCVDARADEFRVELQLMTIQRMLKAVGTYASQAVAGNQIYLPYIKPATDRALAAMKSLGRFDAIRALLERTQS